MNKVKKALKIIKKDHDRYMTPKRLKMTQLEFDDVGKQLNDQGLISGFSPVVYIDNEKMLYAFRYSHVSLKGEQYLESERIINKIYREIKDWVLKLSALFATFKIR